MKKDKIYIIKFLTIHLLLAVFISGCGNNNPGYPTSTSTSVKKITTSVPHTTTSIDYFSSTSTSIVKTSTTALYTSTSYSTTSIYPSTSTSFNSSSTTWPQTTTSYSTTSIDNQPIQLEAFGDYNYRLALNLKDYSDLESDDAYVVGWDKKWDVLLPMIPIENGWAEIIFSTLSNDLQSFAVTNKARNSWFWIEAIEHPLIVPNYWIDQKAQPEEKVMAFYIDGPDSFSYLTGPTAKMPEVVFLGPQLIDVPAGADFILNVQVENLEIFSLGFNFSYDDLVMEFIKAEEGELLNNNCSTLMLTQENIPGEIIFGLTRLGKECGNAQINGIVASLYFKSLGQTAVSKVYFYEHFFSKLSLDDITYDNLGIWKGLEIKIK